MVLCYLALVEDELTAESVQELLEKEESTGLTDDEESEEEDEGEEDD